MTSQLSKVFEIIMVANDGSTQSLHATNVAFSLAEALHSKLQILTVIQLPKPAIRAEVNAILDKANEDWERSFESLRERAKEKNIELETEIAIGHPAKQIVSRADVIDANLIILGGHKISTLQRWMPGSVSDDVLRNARCPVMVVQ